MYSVISAVEHHLHELCVVEVLMVIAHALGNPVHNGHRHLIAELIISLLVQGFPIGNCPSGCWRQQSSMYQLLGGVQQKQVPCSTPNSSVIHLTGSCLGEGGISPGYVQMQLRCLQAGVYCSHC